MSIERVRAYLARFGKDEDILEANVSTATVDLAAAAFGIQPAQIAKTLSFRGDDAQAILIVYAGDARVDNRKFKDKFGRKASMLPPEEVKFFTGYEIGGVCPFDLSADSTKVYLDVSLRRFQQVYPACGNAKSGIALTPTELFDLAEALEWVDAGKDWQRCE